VLQPENRDTMGYLQDGRWHEGWYDTTKTGGEFVRAESGFRDWVSADPAAPYPAEAGRYHLYVSLACPWAHRTLIFRKLKKLEPVISVSVVHPVIAAGGWAFHDGFDDTVNGFAYLHEAYTAQRAGYSGRVTVPVLWDKRSGRIVNNESADIIRMFNSAFDAHTGVKTDYYPERLRERIDATNAFVYDNVNNGVYRCGFAGTQAAYDRAVTKLFDALDVLEERLAASRYLMGDTLTEADWRLFTTLVRFDPVYVTHFKCNVRRLVDYPNLWGYVRDLYQVPGIAETVDFDHIKRHYFESHRHINPSGIVPKGPLLDFNKKGVRDALRL
jgi:putative glutathione S-transferase